MASPETANHEGLTSEVARMRLGEVGRNEITGARAKAPLAIFAGQFASPLIWVLFGASVVSALLHEWIDAIAIGVILVINGVVGFLQEYRAERALLSMRSMTAPRARVARDGHAVSIAAAEVVPGDVLLLEAGDIVAADARLIEAHALSTNEAALTGESVPAQKSTAPVPPSAALAERTDTVFMGTAVSTGSVQRRPRNRPQSIE